jgi:proline iminopeptidase
MRPFIYPFAIKLLFLSGCSESPKGKGMEPDPLRSYLDFSRRDDQFTGGIKMIPISTPNGDYKVWTIERYVDQGNFKFRLKDQT